MSLSEANAFDRAVTAGRLRCPPGLTDIAEIDDADHGPVETGTPTIAEPDFGHLYGRSPVMRALYSQIGKVSNTLATVLIMGESGTGKELIANTVHDMSARADQAFIAVNCGAISPNLIESELFGHEKGSFTGAAQRHIGY